MSGVPPIPRAVCAEVKVLVLMEIGEKSGILVDGTDFLVSDQSEDTRRCPRPPPRPPADAYDWHCISHVGHGELRTLGIGHKLLILCDLWTSIRAQFASTSST